MDLERTSETMTVRVVNHLPDSTGWGGGEYRVAAGMSLGEFRLLVGILRKPCLCVVAGSPRPDDYVLRDHDALDIFPMLAGG